MIINGKNLTEYGAKLLSYKVSGSEISNDYYLGLGSHTPVMLNCEVKMKPLEMVLSFTGTDRFDVAAKVSQFSKAVSQSSEIAMPDGFNYLCILTGISEATQITSTMLEVTYQFSAIQRMNLVTASLNSLNNDVLCQSNVETECVYEITSSTDLETFTLNDMIIHQLDANKTLIIDGLDKLVTQDGINRFADVEMNEFPKLSSGSNMITKSDASVNVILKYYPTFI
jgi:hypothetical protein